MAILFPKVAIRLMVAIKLIKDSLIVFWASQVALMVKNPAANAGDQKKKKKSSFNTWVGKIPWRRAWQPSPVFLPGESHGQRSLAG